MACLEVELARVGTVSMVEVIARRSALWRGRQDLSFTGSVVFDACEQAARASEAL